MIFETLPVKICVFKVLVLQLLSCDIYRIFLKEKKSIISSQYKDFRMIIVYLNGLGVFLIARNHSSV